MNKEYCDKCSRELIYFTHAINDYDEIFGCPVCDDV